jgi:RNA polymerase sigma-70 factor (ECF subfamily)
MLTPFSSNDLVTAIPGLRRYARLLVADPVRADAMVEETLRRAREVSGATRSGKTATIRLLSLLRSVCADQIAQGQPDLPPPPLPPAETPSAGAGSIKGRRGPNPLRAEEPLKQLCGLPVEQREVLVLVAVERMSYEDVAILLDVPVATVLSRLTQARELLRAGAESRAAPKSAS